MAAPMALVVLAVVFLATLAHGFRPYTELINRGLSKPAPKFDFSPPLHLTPYIREGKLAEGRKLAEVRSLPGNEKIQLKSYSGYLTVNDEHDSNMFFWFFPALVRSSILFFETDFAFSQVRKIPRSCCGFKEAQELLLCMACSPRMVQSK